jgi:TonB family protein
MHDCEAIQGEMMDLLFGEAERVRRATLLEEVGACALCGKQYKALAETLGLTSAACAVVEPADSFWTGYGERLRARMASEIGAEGMPGATTRLAALGGDYHLTILDDVGLTGRLWSELRSVAREYELTWPQFRRDPFGFTARLFAGYGLLLRRWAMRDYAAQSALAPLCLALLAAFVWVVTANRCEVLTLFSHRCEQVLTANPYADLRVVGFVGEEIPREQDEPRRPGAAGNAGGKGGGSKPEFERPAGGGGGGRRELLEASQGKLPVAQLTAPILTANPNPPAVKNPSLPVPATIDLDPMLAKVDPRDVPYGLPNSTATVLSSGSGTDGGMGTGSGGGMGSGDGGGLGPGRDGNTGGSSRREGGGNRGGEGDGLVVNDERAHKASEVTRRAVITYRPEPNFTETARRNNVTGTVRLRAVLTASGQVTNISVLKGLPDGLTERAIAAARQIRFTPAQKDGRAVSQWVVIEYNFNIY